MWDQTLPLEFWHDDLFQFFDSGRAYIDHLIVVKTFDIIARSQVGWLAKTYIFFTYLKKNTGIFRCFFRDFRFAGSNIGFLQNLNHQKKFRIFDKLFSAKSKTWKTYIFFTFFARAEKTPEYSGVFSRIFVTNIGFCQNQNHQIKFRIFDKLFSVKSKTSKNLYFLHIFWKILDF